MKSSKPLNMTADQSSVHSSGKNSTTPYAQTDSVTSMDGRRNISAAAAAGSQQRQTQQRVTRTQWYGYPSFRIGPCPACRQYAAANKFGEMPANCQAADPKHTCCFLSSAGPKKAMQAHAKGLPGPQMQLAVAQGWGKRSATTGCFPNFNRSFVVVPDINSNVGGLTNLLSTRIPRADNHANEIIVTGQPCKIIMDFDRDEGFPSEAFDGNRHEFCKQVEAAVTNILSESPFNIQLAPSSFIWMFTDYSYKAKFSAHLVIHHIMPDGSLLNRMLMLILHVSNGPARTLAPWPVGLIAQAPWHTASMKE